MSNFGLTGHPVQWLDQSMGMNELVPSSGGHSQSPAKKRLKKDKTWKYVNESKDEAGKRIFVCTFCNKVFRGGGIFRVKQHLAGVTGNGSPCSKVPKDVRSLMQNALAECSQNAKEKCNKNEDVKVELQTVSPQVTRKKIKASSISDIGIDNTPTSNERSHDADLALAMWLYAACIPTSAVNSPFLPIAMSKIASMGEGYTGPTYHAMRMHLLKDAKQSVKLTVDSFRESWSDTGCTIMCEKWRDSRQQTIINFLVYCPNRISFIKSIDASDIESNSESLCNLFGEIVEIVGSTNVVHLVTDNSDYYKDAGKLLCERYPLICWSPCATHCINLIMKDIEELPHVTNLFTLASRVSVFIYNNTWPLNWLRNRHGWREIIRPNASATRVGTSFIALKSLYDNKSHLQAMVTSNDYNNILTLSKANDVKLIILDETYWQSCSVLVKVIGPILRLLRICESDEKPALGYVYEGMHRARKDIVELFHDKINSYKLYTDIIDARWDKTLSAGLHAAAYWLNPMFRYNEDNPCNKQLAFGGVLDMVETKSSEDSMKLLSQLVKFRERMCSLDGQLAFASRPDEWWKMFGGDLPDLQRFAIRILSQTASSSGCERNWSVFERIHAKKRNRLEHQRLTDLVYVHYNLRLQNRFKDDKRPYDPVDYENIDKTEFWVVDEEPEGELDYGELENMLKEEASSNGDELSGSQT
ncbi:uncharacterized protein LOC143633744 isoform X2 [Bidens hawaiensis]|uniref:uncharacterized protein LOC143633744 isoform X2 n=1 Tax=Bidens hawaiensis TaxID=980011 RepID=UPI00404B55BE